MNAANTIHDAGLELFDADAQLVNAEGATPENSVKFKQVAIQSLITARKKIEQATKQIENELYDAPKS